MDTEGILFTLAYILVSLCIVCPPTEFISAGLTVQNVLAPLLGSEQMDFVHFHIRRTTSTMLIHALLPIGYYVGMILFGNSIGSDFLYPWSLPVHWQLYLAASVVVLWLAMAFAVWWSQNAWSYHPLAQRLQCLAPAGHSWRAMASSINTEFRRFDKFATGVNPGRRIIVTDSWLLRTSAYIVDVARQCDVHLAVVGSDEHEMSPEVSTGIQFLNIDVAGVNTKPFRIRLNATEYGDLKDKLRSPIMNIRNIIIRQTLSERFLEAFRFHVEQNQVYRKPPDMLLEQCVGCMQAVASIKLSRRCADDTDTMSPCRGCRCRPMWCLQCMGRWFASRQDQSQPETWLSCRCPCPTCRAPFCMLDVCRVVS